MKNAEMKIPMPVVAVVADVLGDHYSHSKIDIVFGESGAPGEPPVANKIDKCRLWLTLANNTRDLDAIAVLGGVLHVFMDVDIPPGVAIAEHWNQQRARVRSALGKVGLTYGSGGHIFRGTVGAATKSLESVLRSRDLKGIELEFKRALESVESDAGAAATAACAVVESLCKIYIHDENLAMPSKEDVQHLWHVVRGGLRLDPKLMPEADLATILGGLATVVHGLGALRTHAGSAHGQGRTIYKMEGRHARLAIHSAHTLVVFLIETWDARKRTT